MQVSVLSYGFWATFGDKSDLKDGMFMLDIAFNSRP